MATEEKIDVKDELRMDLMRLEYEWRRQAELCYKWGQLEADAESEVDSLKNKLVVCQANLDLDIRANPIKYNLTSKVTETLIHQSSHCRRVSYCIAR